MNAIHAMLHMCVCAHVFSLVKIHKRDELLLCCVLKLYQQNTKVCPVLSIFVYGTQAYQLKAWKHRRQLDELDTRAKSWRVKYHAKVH